MSVREAILGLLAQQPRHGYELHDVFEALVGGEQNWDIKPAQVYASLAGLEKKGWIIEEAIEQESGPQKRIYGITSSGRLALKKWFVTPVQTNHQRDEFYLKLMLCLASGVGDPYRVIYIQRASLYKELHKLSRQRAVLDTQRELGQILLLEQAMMHLEADLRWIEMVEARLDEVRSQPLPEPEIRPRGRPSKN